MDTSMHAIFQALYYDKIDFFEGINIDITSASKECDIWYYWHFLDKEFISFKCMLVLGVMMH